MLKSLVNTGLNARLTPEVYDRYAEEVTALENNWKKSVSSLKDCKLSFYKEIEHTSIPEAVCQHDYTHVIYDYRECRTLNDGESVPEGYKTLSDAGTIPCALIPILRYYGIHAQLTAVATTLVKYGYRTQNSGTHWIAIDKIPEIIYGIQTRIQSSVFELCESVLSGYPVLTVVSAAWLHNLEYMPGNECVTIWRIDGSDVIVTTTSSHSPRRLNLIEFLWNIKRAWSFQPPTK